MNSKNKITLLRVTYLMLFLLMMFFGIFHFFINPLLANSLDLILIYTCLGLLNLCFVIKPTLSLEAFSRTNITNKDITTLRIEGSIFVALCIFKLIEHC